MEQTPTVVPLDWRTARIARLGARKPLRRLPGLVRDAARLLSRVSPRRICWALLIILVIVVALPLVLFVAAIWLFALLALFLV